MSLLEKQIASQPGQMRDLLNGLVSLGQQAMLPTMLDVQGLPSDMKAYHVPGSPDIKVMTLPQPPNRSHPDDLESLLQLARADKGTIWYDEKGISFVKECAKEVPDRREGAFLSFRIAPLYDKVGRLPKAMTQAELIRFLRIDAAGSWGARTDRLLDAARQIKFRKEEDGESRIELGKSSIGKSINAEIANAQDIPESISLYLPVYSNIGCDSRRFVELAVEINLDDRTFRLLPSGDTLANAMNEVLAYIIAEMAAALPENYPILRGRPW